MGCVAIVRHLKSPKKRPHLYENFFVGSFITPTLIFFNKYKFFLFQKESIYVLYLILLIDGYAKRLLLVVGFYDKIQWNKI